MNKELIELAREVQKLNPEGLVTGGVSLSLQWRYKKLRRPPEDLDFAFMAETDFIAPEGYEFESDDHEYPEDYEWNRQTFVHSNKPKIDVFYPRNKKKINLNQNWQWQEDLRLVSGQTILGFKMRYALDGDYDGMKHREDIAYLMCPHLFKKDI